VPCAACAERRIGDRLQATGAEHDPSQVALLRNLLLRDARAARHEVAARAVVEELFANHAWEVVIADCNQMTISGGFRTWTRKPSI